MKSVENKYILKATPGPIKYVYSHNDYTKCIYC